MTPGRDGKIIIKKGLTAGEKDVFQNETKNESRVIKDFVFKKR